ncbi:cytosolic endo-beta-N-acetylglucosaminidase [Adelges cooleyi]|uniref:cytosolic endo-beta-N-acetylglucosaminidase n=1 Tax=Adelges cooleyi TaxID=133065 RepID=UPI00218017C3|nr:cytosolic endo-beta-N-acetylglucosaminidase [Adelges cooleyi]XP_050424932.1 cytosolic endo-beta-N-acetylglucosaminidase [Adelges cooleyi]
MGTVEISPIKSLEEVLSWQGELDKLPVVELQIRANYSIFGNDYKCHEKLMTPKRHFNRGLPKTLICHDMQGGYKNDRFVNGCQSLDEYTFYNWSIVDTFIYFSHHFVTIPPIGWTNSAHKHGVKCLGTLITEWDDGHELWLKLFTNLEKRDILVNKLVAICKNYSFDGYLINIENNLPIENIENMIETISLLRTKLKAIIPHSEVIWYDSVSMVNGELNWQNQLNVHNKLAFQACDGIFLNYNWKEEDLIKSVINAGSRIVDVYVGVDVFGRNCLGGLECNKSLKIIRKYDLSVAIFAPGWTYETLIDKKQFTETENAFWRSLYPFMYIHIPSTLPLCTNFCRGYGLKKTEKAEVSSVNPWFDLSKLNFQPTVPICLFDSKHPCISHTNSEALTDGGCLRLNGTRENDTYHRILVCNYEIKSKLNLEITVKALKPFNVHKIIVVAIDPYGMPYKMEFGIQGEDNLFFNNCEDYSCVVPNSKIYNLTMQDGWLLHSLSCEMVGIIVEIAVETEEPLLVGRLFIDDCVGD